MNFDELRSYVKTLSGKIEELTDLYARTIREYDDLLHNLTGENFSVEYTKQLKDGFGNFSTIEQTANAIKSLVSGQVNLSAAKQIKDIGDIPDNANKNNIYVIRSYAYDDKSKVTEEQYFYFNTISKKWEQFFGDNIYTVFEQTNEGFKFKGNVIINGSLITEGEIRGINIYASDRQTDQNIALISDDLYEAYIAIGSIGVIRPDATNGQMVVSARGKNGVSDGKLLLSGKTIHFDCEEVQGLGVVPVFGG